MTYTFHVSCFTSLRFLMSASRSFPGISEALPAATSASWSLHVSSATDSTLRSTRGSAPFTMPSHLLCIACLNPTSPTALLTLALNAASEHPSAGTAANACASGEPSTRYVSASGVSANAERSTAVDRTSADASSDFIRPMTFLWSTPLVSANASD